MKSIKNQLVCLNRIVLMIIAVVFTLILSTILRAATTTGDCAKPVIEQYGIGGSTPLKWKAFVPNDGLKHPAVIVIHGGISTNRSPLRYCGSPVDVAEERRGDSVHVWERER